MSLNRGQHKRRNIRRRVQSSKAPRALTSGVARDLRGARPGEEAYVVRPQPADGLPPSVPSALEKAALQALGSEQPREVSPEDVYRLMTPSPASTEWGNELTEDRRNMVVEDPWDNR